jgi:outer membrane protein assembly factor BamB
MDKCFIMINKFDSNNRSSITIDEPLANYELTLHPHKPFLYAIFLGLFVALSGWMTYPVHGSNWNQWRGSLGDGSHTSDPWPASIDEKTLVTKWSSEKLGASYSGPITDGNLVFTTESSEDKESVLAFTLKDGKLKWKQNWSGKMKVPFFAARNGSWIRSTPAVANGRIFVGGMRDHLLCLNTKSGEIEWEIDFPKKFKSPLPDFGFASSPLVDQKHVYVQAGASFNKIDQETGTIIWRTIGDKGGMWGSAFSSPTFAKIDGQNQILVLTRSDLNGINPEDGKALWKMPIKAFRGMNILTPLPFKDGIFTSAYGGGSSFIRVGNKQNKWSATLKWKNKSQGYMCSPVQYDGKAYLHLRNNRFACFDLETGKEEWVSSKSFGKYMSLIINNDKILALDQKGILYLIQANPKKLNILSERRLPKGESWAHLGVQNRMVMVRSLNRLHVFDWKI